MAHLFDFPNETCAEENVDNKVIEIEKTVLNFLHKCIKLRLTFHGNCSKPVQFRLNINRNSTKHLFLKWLHHFF